ncbi:hypothetical protein FH588_02220 (plasmid) [Leptospira interrogans]|uniref:hypothetical protein n=1 Tax=Leptospira interrogans TaxID=173 RepID=UPI001F4D13C2|nr:hypothetical protein [Leptospira interrogans]UNE65252.1 hypothetical protein FH588_02220 [Leptospira interrogans]
MKIWTETEEKDLIEFVFQKKDTELLCKYFKKTESQITDKLKSLRKNIPLPLRYRESRRPNFDNLSKWLDENGQNFIN